MSEAPILIDAVKAGDVAQVKSILEAQPNLLQVAQGSNGESLLLLSVYHHQPDITQILLAKNPVLSIHEAAATGDLETVQKLLQEDQTAANTYSPDGFSPLGLACFFNHADIARLLVAQGAYVNAASQNAMHISPIHSAVAARNTELVQFLLDQGADINATQTGGYTALHAAAHNGDEGLIKLLLEHMADINAMTDSGKTPMELAISSGHDAAKWFSL
ncbi:MAG: ankyrin repeat-containing protein [Adhaeribacter sp.]|jgi:ankyrin repeat protein|nr:ankyrin repeat-containing protein [Adhaeribacter sp.]